MLLAMLQCQNSVNPDSRNLPEQDNIFKAAHAILRVVLLLKSTELLYVQSKVVQP